MWRTAELSVLSMSPAAFSLLRKERKEAATSRQRL